MCVDVATGEETAKMVSHGAQVTSVSVSPGVLNTYYKFITYPSKSNLFDSL
jgi:hypothetical protein